MHQANEKYFYPKAIPNFSRNRGFTLIEVILALLIFGISLLAITRAMGQSARGLMHIEQKNYAHWVARNATNQLLLGLEGNYLRLGAAQGEMLMGHNTYQWRSKTESTEDPAVWIIHVNVTLSNQTNSLANLSTYSRAVRRGG